VHEGCICGRVRHIIYSCVPRADGKTARLQALVKAAGGTWRDVAVLPEADLAQLVRQDKVDILVDLTGHTANNRLGTFAMRPAPIQVSFPSQCPTLSVPLYCRATLDSSRQCLA
jgi:predicted O-linked N-acetylglucosamine transferase (SPINDLY family)